MKSIAIKIIRLYQVFSKTIMRHNGLPLLFPAMCRFHPTCSDYMINEISQRGIILGFGRGFVRILKCNPIITTNPKS